MKSIAKLRSAAAALGCAVAVLFSSGCTPLSIFNEKHEYEDTLALAYTAIAKNDAEMYTKILPPCYMDYFMQYNTALRTAGYGNVYDLFGEQLQKYTNEYGEMQISHTVRGDTKLSDSEISDIEEYLSQYSDEPVEIESGYEVICDVKIDGSLKDGDFRDSLTMIEIDGTWYYYTEIGS